jgi:hypothetical protein
MKKPATPTRRNGTVRCAIYTRKSSEEGLEQEFNSLTDGFSIPAASTNRLPRGSLTHQYSTGVSRGPQRSASTGPSCRWPASALSSPP